MLRGANRLSNTMFKQNLIVSPQWFRCGPCHQIAPVFEAFSKQYPNVNFLKCDVDAAKAVSSKYKVTAM